MLKIDSTIDLFSFLMKPSADAFVKNTIRYLEFLKKPIAQTGDIAYKNTPFLKPPKRKIHIEIQKEIQKES